MSCPKNTIKNQRPDIQSMSTIELFTERGEGDTPESVEIQDNSDISLVVNFDEGTIVKSDTSLSGDEKSPLNVNRSRSSTSRYTLHGRPRMPPSALNNFLDLLSMCFWKCSPGCQQLPKDNKKV